MGGTTTEPFRPGSHAPQQDSSPHLLQIERVCGQQRRPSIAKIIITIVNDKIGMTLWGVLSKALRTLVVTALTFFPGEVGQPHLLKHRRP